MRFRIFVAALVLVSVMAAGALATGGDRLAPAQQSAIVYLSEPTLIGSTMVQGGVLFTHDQTKMAGGGACATVHVFDLTSGPLKEIVSFGCIPAPRAVVATFTLTTRPNVASGIGRVLTELQFAGDAEAHRVPTRVNGR